MYFSAKNVCFHRLLSGYKYQQVSAARNNPKAFLYDRTGDLLRHISKVTFFFLILSLELKDGTVECEVVYANLSDACLALSLSPCQLGDRIFTVSPDLKHKDRIDLCLKSSEAERKISEDSLRTLTIEVFKNCDKGEASPNNLPNYSLLVEELKSYIPDIAPLMISDTFVECRDGDLAIIFEFSSYSDMCAAKSLFRNACRYKVRELSLSIDHDVRKSKMKDVLIYGVPMSKLFEASSNKREHDSRGVEPSSNRRSKSPKSRFSDRRSGSSSENIGTRHGRDAHTPASSSERRPDTRRDYGKNAPSRNSHSDAYGRDEKRQRSLSRTDILSKNYYEST